MRRQFARYPAFKRNYNDELLSKLKDLVKSKLTLRRVRPRSAMSDATNEPEDLMNDMEIDEEELADKVGELSSTDYINLFDVQARYLNVSTANLHAFFKCPAFLNNNFAYNPATKKITFRL